MQNKAFVGGVYLWRGDGGSPQTFTRVCQVFGMSGIGETNALVDATTFCSEGSAEYIGGLKDGSEATFELNYETVLPDAQVIDDMIQDVKDKALRSFELRAHGDITDPSTVMQTFHLDALALSWALNPSPTAKNGITFGFKISGDIDVTRP